MTTQRQYESRKEGGRGLSSDKDSFDTSIWRLKDYIKKCWGRPETIQTVKGSAEQKLLENKCGKENKCMAIASDK